MVKLGATKAPNPPSPIGGGSRQPRSAPMGLNKGGITRGTSRPGSTGGPIPPGPIGGGTRPPRTTGTPGAPILPQPIGGARKTRPGAPAAGARPGMTRGRKTGFRGQPLPPGQMRKVQPRTGGHGLSPNGVGTGGRPRPAGSITPLTTHPRPIGPIMPTSGGKKKGHVAKKAVKKRAPAAPRPTAVTRPTRPRRGGTNNRGV